MKEKIFDSDLERAREETTTTRRVQATIPGWGKWVKCLTPMARTSGHPITPPPCLGVFINWGQHACFLCMLLFMEICIKCKTAHPCEVSGGGGAHPSLGGHSADSLGGHSDGNTVVVSFCCSTGSSVRSLRRWQVSLCRSKPFEPWAWLPSTEFCLNIEQPSAGALTHCPVCDQIRSELSRACVVTRKYHTWPISQTPQTWTPTANCHPLEGKHADLPKEAVIFHAMQYMWTWICWRGSTISDTLALQELDAALSLQWILNDTIVKRSQSFARCQL